MHLRARTSHRTPTVALALVLAWLAASCQPPPATIPPDDSDIGVVGRVDGFQRPWDVQFTPDGTALVTERAGVLAAVVSGERRVLGTVSGVVARGEGGLMGLAVDPAFASNRWIYTCQTAATDVRVVRHRVLPGYTGFTDSTPIVTGIPIGGGNRHQGCRPAFGPDGNLWLGTGDAAIGSVPQDTSSLGGKVLRFSRNGTPATTNPGVVNPSSGWHPLIHTMGHRNVQGLAFRPGTGTAYGIEHGTGCDDEINRLTVGANFGWNPVGPGGSYDESHPMTFPGGAAAAWSSGCPTIATSGGAFVTDPMWGDRQGWLAVAALKDQALHLFRVDGDQVVHEERVLTGNGRLRSVTVGPDGSLWITTDAASGSILQVRPK